MRHVLLVALLCSGCLVSKKKFDALSTDLATEQSAHAKTSAELASAQARTKDLDASLTSERARVTELEAYSAKLDGQAKEFQSQIEGLNAQKASLLSDQSSLKASVAEMRRALADLQARKAEADARVAEFRGLLARFRSLIDAGKLSVKIVDGRMVVELATDVLFASGQATLSPQGMGAIGEVSAVLATIPDRKFQVEGHTDNVPIKTAQYPSNWELAAARALTVVRTMIEAGLPPARVSAAAFGETRPVTTNDTPEGRASNRRIQIVVVPDLSSLPGFDELGKVGG
jgi:chemotaxis protein MotB